MNWMLVNQGRLVYSYALCTPMHMTASLYQLVISRGEEPHFVCMQFCPTISTSLLYHDVVIL